MTERREQIVAVPDGVRKAHQARDPLEDVELLDILLHLGYALFDFFYFLPQFSEFLNPTAANSSGINWDENFVGSGLHKLASVKDYKGSSARKDKSPRLAPKIINIRFSGASKNPFNRTEFGVL